MTAEEFRSILAAPEGTRLEFKEAANRYDFDELVRYCVAIANEGGGRIVLGVTDARPRRVVGTAAFPEPGQTESSIFQRVGHHVSIEEFHHDRHRVLIFSVPARFSDTAGNDRAAYRMGAGESLLPMTDERSRVIHAGVAPDFACKICADTSRARCTRPEVLWGLKRHVRDFGISIAPPTHYFSMTSMGRYPHSGLQPHS